MTVIVPGARAVEECLRWVSAPVCYVQEYVKSNSSNSSKLKLQESSLFGSSGSDKFPLDTSAADIIKQMKPEKSSPASLLPSR